jgi:hypothetical protein
MEGAGRTLDRQTKMAGIEQAAPQTDLSFGFKKDQNIGLANTIFKDRENHSQHYNYSNNCK